MKQIYHKGKYRSGEWCKHLKPFLKRVGNKRWRKEGRVELMDIDNEAALSVPGQKHKKKAKRIKVKFTMESIGGFKSSYYAFYATMKQAEDAIRRNEVIRATVFERKGKIITTR
jgi:hypothetical protein